LTPSKRASCITQRFWSQIIFPARVSPDIPQAHTDPPEVPHGLPELHDRAKPWLIRGLDRSKLPRHIGFIPDGNRRWADRHGLELTQGHSRGRAKAQEVVGWCADLGIEVVTLFTLSTGNLTRGRHERLTDFVEELVTGLAASRRFRLRLIGDLQLLPASTQEILAAAMDQPTGPSSTMVNLLICYTGRQDIVAAVRNFLLQPELRTADAERLAHVLNAHEIDRHLSTAGQPEIDLIIRTSGEQRLSGFLTWQAAQAELYFTRRYWPDFRRKDLQRALRDYGQRERRFGA